MSIKLRGMLEGLHAHTSGKKGLYDYYKMGEILFG
jgi:hypothetical protein